MAPSAPIAALFLDIGGVLLTNGWDRGMRARAAETFGLDLAEMNERHTPAFEVYETGRSTLDEYLARVVFYEDRPFTAEQFKAFIFAQSRPYPEMIEGIQALKTRYHLKLVAVNNEGREINLYRIRTFRLTDFIDAFVSSCFVHVRKPDVEIFRLALDISQVPAPQVVYLDDRGPFIETARELGLQGIHHTGYESTRAHLGALGLSMDG